MQKQSDIPIFHCLKNLYSSRNITPFHVPGHKQGRGIAKEFKDFLGENIFKIDVTIFDLVDGLHSPKSHIKSAMELCAETYGAKKSFFSINGTTGAIQAMIMAAVGPNEKILVPRNIHTSVYAGIVLSGAIPIYMSPEIDNVNALAHGVSPNTVKETLLMHPDASAVLVINPTYYGVATDLEIVARTVHSYGIPLLVDEAHGAHLKFHDGLPPSAMEVGADACAQSTHKILGALTQASMLHIQGDRLQAGRVKQALNMLQTTSPSYILLASLDFARYQMAISGEKLISGAVEMAKKLRKGIRRIDNIDCMDETILDGEGAYALDPTKVTVSAKKLGISGWKLEKYLLDDYNIQVELSDCYNVLFIVTYADMQEDIQTVLDALTHISDRSDSSKILFPKFTALPPQPYIESYPRDAFFSKSYEVPINSAEGLVSGEFIMAYPPGIPIVCPGEVISREVINYIDDLRAANISMQGLRDTQANFVQVLFSDVNQPVEAERLVSNAVPVAEAF